jgi:hypothetical protein
MNWSTIRTRIRRFLRDPDGNIWTDAFLLRCFNDAQQDMHHRLHFLEDVEAIRVPPYFQMSYLYDWEWTYRDTDGICYRALRYYDAARCVCTCAWEPEILANVAGTTSDLGGHFTHPWEAFIAPWAVADEVWLRLPTGFERARFAYWDKEPIDPLTKKEIQRDDPSWQTRSGTPFGYYRPSTAEEVFCLYPRPDNPVWDDGEVDATGTVLFDDTDTEDSEYGTYGQGESLIFDTDAGLTVQVLRADNNVLFIFAKTPTSLALDEDSPDYPDHICKYVIPGVLELAYSANTDGRIKTLAEYWGYRKEVGYKVLEKYLRRRRTDRDYRLVTHGSPGGRTRREPRLPDAYPAVYVR